MKTFIKIKPIKIYLDEDVFKKLKQKAEDSGFIGKGAISHYITKVATEPICFVDNNLKTLLSVIKDNK